MRRSLLDCYQNPIVRHSNWVGAKMAATAARFLAVRRCSIKGTRSVRLIHVPSRLLVKGTDCPHGWTVTRWNCPQHEAVDLDQPKNADSLWY